MPDGDTLDSVDITYFQARNVKTHNFVRRIIDIRIHLPGINHRLRFGNVNRNFFPVWFNDRHARKIRSPIGRSIFNGRN